MADLTYDQIGTNLHARIENIPAGYSGAQVLAFIEEARSFAEDWTGTDPGSPVVASRFVGAVTCLAGANIVNGMQTFGADVSSVQLGEFNVKKGSDTNLSTVGRGLEKAGMEKLKGIGRRVIGARIIGGT